MKQITIDRRTFQYRERDDYTEFYDGEVEVEEYYGIFKKLKRTVKKPKFVFQIYGYLTTNPNFSKKDVRDLIMKQVNLLKRKEEIERGEII